MVDLLTDLAQSSSAMQDVITTILTQSVLSLESDLEENNQASYKGNVYFMFIYNANLNTSDPAYSRESN